MEVMHLYLIIMQLLLELICAQKLRAIAGLIKTIQTGCVYIAYSENEQVINSKNLIRALSMEGVAASVSDVKDWLLHHQHLQCGHQRPFYIMLDPSRVRQTVIQERVSEVQWLLVLPMNAPGQIEADILQGILVNVNCLFFVARATTAEGDFQLFEVYRLAKDRPLLRRRYGLWTLKRGFQRTSSGGIYVRRTDLQGITIKAITLEDKTNTELKFVNNKTILKGGFYGKVWQVLEEKLNFKTEFSVVTNLTWLSQENQTVLSKNDTQVAVISIAMKSNRVEIHQYTFPLYGNKYHLFIREPSARQLVWTSILAPFKREVWFAILGCLFTFFLCVTIVAQIFNRCHLKQELMTSPDSLSYLFGAFCYQGFEPNTSLNTIRLLFALANLLGVIILASYSADLISDLSNIKIQIPFRGLQGLAKDGTYQLGTHPLSTGLLPDFYIKNSSWQRVYQKVLYPEYKANVPKTEPEALARVCNKHYAYFSHVFKILPFINEIRPCRLMKLPGSVKIKLSIVFAKHSPYFPLFNYYIKRLRISGHLRKLRNTLLSTSLNDKENLFISVNLETATPILTIILFGILLSVFFLILELCSQREIEKN